MEKLYKEVASLMFKEKEVVVLTGSGISAESGIPTFRSTGGLWTKYDPMIYAHIDTFRKDPSKYWEIRGEFIKNYDSYKPNKAHLALAELENLGIVKVVITQNIDGLHTKAGSKDVIEIHGSLREIYCLSCNKKYIAPNIPEGNPPYCEDCKGILKPNTVLFGESLPPSAINRAYKEAQFCKIMLVIGTSSTVYPAAYLPLIAKDNGAKIVEINIEPSFPQANYVIKEKASIALEEILTEIKNLSIK